MDSNITKSKKDAVATGVFFILAAVSSIIGLKLYDPILQNPDFILVADSHYQQIVFGAVNELILVCSAAGTGIMMFPYLKRLHESYGIAYLSFRLLEVVFIMIGTISILAVLDISDLHLSGTIQDKSDAQNLGFLMISIHKWSFMLGPNFMLAINTFIYIFVFFQTTLVPQTLAIWGLNGASLIMLAAFLELFGIIEQISFWGILLALPIALYEMTLAIYLIWKGFQLKNENNATS